MAEIRYEYIDNKHPLTTYEEVFDAYFWILEALEKVFPKGHIDFSADFKSGNMIYSCDGFDDFKKYAFGRTVEIKSIFFMVRNEKKQKLISVYGLQKNEGYQEYTLASEDEGLISDLVELLKKEKKSKDVSDNKVIVNYEDNSIHIGDGNKLSETIIGSGNRINKTSEAPKEKWYSKIAWNIVVPIFVGVIILIIGACLGLDG